MTIPDLEPAALEATAEHLLRLAKVGFGYDIKTADRVILRKAARYLAARSVPEAGKAVTDTWSSICAHARGDADYARMPLGLTSRAEPLAEQALRRLIYPVSTEINPRGWEFREKPMLEEAVRFLQEASALASVAPSGAEPDQGLWRFWNAKAQELAVKVDATRAEATFLRRKLEEHKGVLAEARERINRYADTAEEHDLVARIDALEDKP